MNVSIERIENDDELGVWLGIIRTSFSTVAEDFGITRENAPTNPAFPSMSAFSGGMPPVSNKV